MPGNDVFIFIISILELKLLLFIKQLSCNYYLVMATKQKDCFHDLFVNEAAIKTSNS
jgi:hypothetical protein